MRTRAIWLSGKVALIGVFVFGLAPGETQARDLKEIIPGLFGGDGITLDAGHFAHFEEESLLELNTLSDGIAQSINLTSLGSAVSSFTFDASQAVFVRNTESLGPLFAERAETVGKGKLDVAFSYSGQEFKRFEGDDLDDLRLVLPHEDTCSISGSEPPCGPGDGVVPSPGVPDFENDTVGMDLDIELEQSVAAFFFDYGITSRWDVGLVVPIVRTQLEVDARAFINPVSGSGVHEFCTVRPCLVPDADLGINENEAVDSGSDDRTGIGDILLRTKYNFLLDRSIWPDLAAAGIVKLETGDEDNYLGTGYTSFLAFLIASKTYWRFSPHLNVGTEITTRDAESNNFRVIAGTEFFAHERLTFSVDFLGRHAFEDDGVADHVWDVAFGAKVNPYSTLTFFGGAWLPLNRNEGLRPDVGWTVGVEYTF